MKPEIDYSTLTATELLDIARNAVSRLTYKDANALNKAITAYLKERLFDLTGDRVR